MKWAEFFLDVAQTVSKKSKDPSTKVGCVIVGEQNNVLSVGFNGFPIDVDESIDERWNRPDKYDWVCHAEKNAIDLAARHGTRLEDSTMYVSKNSICLACGKSIIQAGIGKVVLPEEKTMSKKWRKDMNRVRVMFEEAGISLEEVCVQK